MSHANKADKLLIKPTAGARPASPRTLGRFIRKTRVSRSDARRVTNGTDDTTLTTAPDGPTQRLSQTPEDVDRPTGRSTLWRYGRLVKLIAGCPRRTDRRVGCRRPVRRL